MAGKEASVPSLSPRHVHRPRLTRPLDAWTGQAIVLTAPAGYGKTALAAEWLAERPAAWYRASPAAADLAAFSVGVADALQSLVPGAGERLRQRVRVGEAPETAVRPLAELLAEDLERWPEGAWLAIDDYHVVAESAAVEEFVDWLLALSPLRLIVTTRRRPTWVSARRVLYGEITELTRDELALTAEEGRLVLGDGRGQAVARLVEQAQGWPALIGLASLSASFAVPSARISEALFQYFAEEVLRSEPAEIQELMLAAAVPAVVDARIAGEVLELADPDAGLRRLEEKGLLHPAGRASRRFHPLLRDFLRAKLQEDPARAREIVDRVLADARREGRWDEAFELAIESGQLEEAADVLAAAAPGLLAAGRMETVERWLRDCGQGALTRPAVALARGEVLIRRGKLFEALEAAQELAQGLAADDPVSSSAWYLAGRAFQLLSEDEQALVCHLKACETAQNAHDRTNALWGATVLAAQLESDVIHGLVAEMEPLASEDLDARLQLASGRAFLAASQGSLSGVWESVEPLLHHVERAADPIAKNNFLTAAAYLATSRCEYALAHELAGRAVAASEEYRLGSLKTAFSLCQRAAAEVGLRRFADAKRTLERIERLGIGHTSILLWENANLRLKLRLARGDLAGVLEASAPAPEGSGTNSSVGEHAGLVAIAAAALGDAERTRAETGRAREVTGSVEARFYTSFAEAILDSGSVRRARRALADAAEAEMLDAFVIAYRAHPKLAALLAADPASLPLVRTVLPAANDGALGRRVDVDLGPEPEAPGLEELTPRENEVLGLMAEGLGNAEISRRLFISEKTTKVHVHHIFRKLGVQTRVQAVLALREVDQ